MLIFSLRVGHVIACRLGFTAGTGASTVVLYVAQATNIRCRLFGQLTHKKMFACQLGVGVSNLSSVRLSHQVVIVDEQPLCPTSMVRCGSGERVTQ